MHPILLGCSQVRASSGRRAGTWDVSLNFNPCRFPAHTHSFDFWALPRSVEEFYPPRETILPYCYVLSHFSCVWLCATLRTVARQASLSMGFSRQDHWSGLPCHPPGDLPDPGIGSPALAGRFFTTSAHLGSPRLWGIMLNKWKAVFLEMLRNSLNLLISKYLWMNMTLCFGLYKTDLCMFSWWVCALQ